MRILIDLQACQATGSRHRGIGRYSLALAKAMAKNAQGHEIHLMLNANFPETISILRQEFKELVPNEHIHVWYSLDGVSENNYENQWRVKVGELIREQALAELKPDFIHVTSLFEGLGDDAVTSIGQTGEHIPTAVTLYDLIPLIHSNQYLQDSQISTWYYRKLQAIKRADLVLSISESSRQEGLNCLNLPEEQVVNISSAVDDRFCQRQYSQERILKLKQQYQLDRPYVMYTGGIDLRKNIESLIRAFSVLPTEIRKLYQLAIVCSIQNADRERLQKLIQETGLQPNDVVLTGFVADDDLPVLYQCCDLFVFPSWHEGFGLPALEAMACGAPVIASNTSSLPEVMSNAEALFNPYDESDIAASILKGLTDPLFVQRLRKNGEVQAKKFSWESSAKNAITAMERYHQKHQKAEVSFIAPIQKPRLAFISPLPSAQTGIANYSAELLPELDLYYQIELITDQEDIEQGMIKSIFPVHNVSWFEENAHQFDRVIYHIGNSPFHSHMFALLEKFPGVVVLHDFYISNIHSHLDFVGEKKGGWAQELYDSHGFSALVENAQAKDVHQIIWKYPCNRSVINNATGIIVHSDYSKQLAKEWFGEEWASDWQLIPHLRKLPTNINRQLSRMQLGITDGDFLVCAFGMLGPTKLNEQLLRVWIDSPLAKNVHCHLVFVGQNDDGEYGENLSHLIQKNELESRVKITGFADSKLFSNYLQAADLGVQLRTLARGETSGTVLDCMAHGLATIINGNGSMAELPGNAVHKIRDHFSDSELRVAIMNLWEGHNDRLKLGLSAKNYIAKHHAPTQIGLQYATAIESFNKNSVKAKRSRLLQTILSIDKNKDKAIQEKELYEIAKSISMNSQKCQKKRLFLDVTELAKTDSKSGIQRVVRSILFALLKRPPQDFRVEPVIVTPQGLIFAREFTCQLLEIPSLIIGDDIVETQVGDVFLGLDLNFDAIVGSQVMMNQLKDQGVLVYFIIYDLLPILIPDCFPEDLSAIFEKWLEVVMKTANGVLCISHTVAEEFAQQLQIRSDQKEQDFKIASFHLGADIASSLPSDSGVPLAEELLSALKSKTCFLMVGTVEPRKGHQQSLDAFELLWQKQVDVCLVIVGSPGWKTRSLVERIQAHPENNKRLFLIEKCCDTRLNQLYQTSSALLMSSIGEGFGLPLIEAAHYHLPIIARDLSVFKEVAGEHAFYFQGTQATDLSSAIQVWLTLFNNGLHPQSGAMKSLSWDQSAEQLCKNILE